MVLSTPCQQAMWQLPTSYLGKGSDHFAVEMYQRMVFTEDFRTCFGRPPKVKKGARFVLHLKK